MISADVRAIVSRRRAGASRTIPSAARVECRGEVAVERDAPAGVAEIVTCLWLGPGVPLGFDIGDVAKQRGDCGGMRRPVVRQCPRRALLGIARGVECG